MSDTPSKMIDLGLKAPDFKLIDTIDNKFKSSSDLFKLKGILVMFICNHCPFVIHIIDEIVRISNEYNNSISFVAICSNDSVKYPADSPKLMKLLAKEREFNFPYLHDESQEVAKMYNAACTPDFFLYDSEKNLVYRGQLDGSRPGNEIPVTGFDLRNAIDCLIRDVENTEVQKPSIGCNIKWK